MSNNTVHPTAIISANACLGRNVAVGPFSVIEDNVVIGDNSVVGSHCHLGIATPLATTNTLTIGADSLIRSHSVFYCGSVFGAKLTTGHRVTVRENTEAGDNLQIGTLGDIQGHCRMGDHVRCHSNVFIAHGSVVGNFVWLFPYVALTNDPTPPSETISGITICDFAAIAAASTVLPGLTVGKDALVGANTLVRQDVPDGMICVGNPGKLIGRTDRINLKNTNTPAYPWRRHFHRGYPADIVARWKDEFPT